ncbi:MAG: helix-turn-helix transcriptional regulator [Lachnospiraceae bacterium]|nr:helix-turn-helix transcriptional regulator [Lachnospiraceae bacterium]MBQ1514617.1 helix-turn-helix transcriptional regulator [Lachnospiraceae bacterium]
MKYETGERIRRLRKSRGLSQKDFASRLGVSNSRVSNWEQGINRPDADILAQICRVLNVSPSEILNVRIAEEEYSEHEKQLIRSYRERKDLQGAVDLLLGLGETV